MDIRVSSEETNLYYLNSRYYDPEVGRFISLDAVDYLAPDSIHGLNLFAYCFNNPIMYVDPSGHIAISLIVGLLVGSFALGFGISVVDQGFSYGWDKINYLQAGIDGLFALGTTALSFTGIPAWGMAFIGASTGFGQYAIDCGFHNEQMTWLGAVTSTLLDGIFGMISGAGARNAHAVSKKMIGLSDEGARAISAITNAANRRFWGEISEKGMQATLNLYGRTAFNAVQAAIPGTIEYLMIKSIVPSVFLSIANAAVSYLFEHVYDRLGW